MSETTLTRPVAPAEGELGPDLPEPAVLRLRRSVHVRTLEHRGVAVSAGHDAVVLDGAAAEQLWMALEPMLRVGVTAEALLASVPERARRVIDGLWQQLVDHRLLCVAGQAGEEAAEAAGPLAEHFERTAQDPGRAMARTRTATVRVSGDPALAQVLREALVETGVTLDAWTDAPDAPEASDAPDAPDARLAGLAEKYAVLTLHLPAQRHHVLVARAGGHRLVGPLPSGEAERTALRRWLDRRAAEAVTPMRSRDRIADALAAAQGVLVVLEILGESSPPGPAPVFHLTTPDVVAERHPLAVLPSPGPADEVVDLEGLLATDEAPVQEDELLRVLEPLWSGPLTTWRGPVPDALPQLPIGLAVAGSGTTDLVGVGLDTADARLSCVEQLAEHATGLSVGRTLSAAVARAVTRAVQHGLWLPDRDAPPVTTPLARRLLQALTLREGVPVTLRSGSPGGVLPLTRIEVLDERGGRLATGLAADGDRAVEEALLAALGAVQAAPHGVSVSTTPVPRLPGTQRDLLRWASARGLMVRRPAGPPVWSALGLHGCLLDDAEDQA